MISRRRGARGDPEDSILLSAPLRSPRLREMSFSPSDDETTCQLWRTSRILLRVSLRRRAAARNVLDDYEPLARRQKAANGRENSPSAVKPMRNARQRELAVGGGRGGSLARNRRPLASQLPVSRCLRLVQ